MIISKYQELESSGVVSGARENIADGLARKQNISFSSSKTFRMELHRVAVKCRLDIFRVQYPLGMCRVGYLRI